MFKRRFTLAVCAAVFIWCFPHTPIFAEMNINTGIEQFNWKEYERSGQKLLEESGLRTFIGFEMMKDVDAGFLLGFAGKIYTGRVDYDGASQDSLTGETTPFKTDTNYFGAETELRPRYRTQPAFLSRHYIDLAGTVGLDVWFRQLVDGTNLKGERVLGYIENYFIFYARAGFEITPKNRSKGLYAGVGVKYPFLAFEKAYLTRIGYDSDPVLRPQPGISYYGHVGIRLNRKWRITAYYDSYNFGKSPEVLAQQNGVQYLVHQPESLQYTLGLMLNYHFSLKSDGS